MRYLKGNERFTWENDDGEEKPFLLEENGAKHDATVAEVFLHFARGFVPQQGSALTIDEIETLNAAKRVLRRPPEGEYHAFQIEEWNILSKVLLWVAVAPGNNVFFLAPRIKKLAAGILEKLPEPPKPSEQPAPPTPP